MKKTLAFLAVVTLCVFVGTANAGFTYSFVNITGNSATNAQIGEDQLFVEVSDNGSSQVQFDFTNSGPLDSTVANIYFEDSLGMFASIDSVVESAGVDFAIDLTPGNLPGGNTISFVEDYEAFAVAPAPQKGIDPDESLGILFTLSGGISYDDLIASLDDGTTRIGMHVISFPDGGGESFVNNGRENPPVVPAPGAVILAGIGTGIVGWLRKRKDA